MTFFSRLCQRICCWLHLHQWALKVVGRPLDGWYVFYCECCGHEEACDCGTCQWAIERKAGVQ